MSNRDDYEKKLETLKAIPDDRVKSPHHVPVEAYIQEAQALYLWALEDKDSLTAAGLSRQLVEDLPVRIGALVEAESLWYIQRSTREKAAAAWDQESRLAYKLKKQLHDVFRYAFCSNPDLLETLRFTVKGKSHAKMIQALNDLSLLGEKKKHYWKPCVSICRFWTRRRRHPNRWPCCWPRLTFIETGSKRLKKSATGPIRI